MNCTGSRKRRIWTNSVVSSPLLRDRSNGGYDRLMSHSTAGTIVRKRGGAPSPRKAGLGLLVTNE